MGCVSVISSLSGLPDGHELSDGAVLGRHAWRENERGAPDCPQKLEPQTTSRERDDSDSSSARAMFSL